jgi:hypothetical protein
MCFYKFENKSARILHLSVGDGQTLAIPPSEGGITLEIEDSQKPALQANIATPAVQAWINDGQLTITEVEEEPPPPEAGLEGKFGQPLVKDGAAEPPQDVFTPDAPPPPEPPPEIPEHVRRGKRSRDD